MKPESRGVIVGLTGLIIGLGVGFHFILIGYLYDNWSHKGSFSIVFFEIFIYWIGLGIFIIYRKFYKKYND
jgi:hypothetical protein